MKFMDSKQLIVRALKKEFLSAEEGQYLFENTPTAELMWAANELKKMQVPGNIVTWQIDRNVNTTNACIANCKFCNFFRHPKHKEVYITDVDTYKRKIEETIKYGGANDMGSIMIEENVVSVAGAPHRFTADSIENCILEADFVPQLRNQLYEKRRKPKHMVNQVIDY